MTPVQIQKEIEEASRHHQAGRLAEAERSYRQVLTQQPNHTGALYLLGTLAAQVGQRELAIEIIRRAIAVEPGNSEAHHNLANILLETGRLEEAIAAYWQAVQLETRSAVFQSNLGNALRAGGRYEEAIAACREAVRLDPDFAGAHNNLGLALQSRKQWREAVESHQEAVRLAPEVAGFHYNLANALRANGQADEAIAGYRETLRLEPVHPDALNNCGIALQNQGRFDEAIASYKQAIRLKPDLVIAWSNLGHALHATGRFDEAVAACTEALRIDPNLAEAANKLGAAFVAKEQFQDGIAALRHALVLNPDFAEAHNNLGNCLKNQGQLDEAIESYQRAIVAGPDLAEAHNNLGNCFMDQGRLHLALEFYRRAVLLDPQAANIHSNLVYALHFHPDYDDFAILRENQEWDRRHAEPLRRDVRPHEPDPSATRRLRIGYISPDLRCHVVGWNFIPLIREHDRREFEIFCYADVRRPDVMTEQFRLLSDHWRDITGLEDARVAEIVRADRVDILVDLTLHMNRNRLVALAHRPAPIQASYLASANAGGLSMIDYRFSDSYLDPPELDASRASGPIFRLPHSAWCYQPSGLFPEVSALPALRAGFVCFASRNNFWKVSPAVLELWMAVLEKVPRSRLLLYAPPGTARDSVRRRFLDRGLAEERLEFAGREPWEEFLRSYERVDIVLDPFPYSGWITSCDALAMGVPVVALAWRTVMGRGGKSILSNIGLPELVAETAEDFIAKAVALADDLPRLSKLRSSLRERMESSPLRDARRHARDVEVAYRAMWREWCTPKSAP